MNWNWIYARAVFFPTLCWNALLGRWLGARRWWDRVDDHVLIGALPFASDVPRLREEGVRAVVNTCEEYGGPVAAYDRAEIEQLRTPTIDFTHPSLESVVRAVDFISAWAEKGHATYVHCKAGRGRSATVVVCWLMKSRQWTPDQAQQFLLEKRAHVNRHLSRRPVVRQYYEQRVKQQVEEP
ncbi:MAG: phosphatidylglycerophosphatase and protein-tyrosine phosphatase 1 family protein [Pirellulaceae bacterium]|nr:phosphatidylglycerophosphatase and protein-tyrosine phosphatase 1 family protein [Pirellulaceae bacterium]MDP7018675.1 phosphatidylglycerophosphatase and protein-tyrosine phosphatase 1 family protein [Pirellulaceae bacterium]